MTALWALVRPFIPWVALALTILLALALVTGQFRRAAAEREAREAVRARAGAEVSRAGEAASGAAVEAVAGLGDREGARVAQERKARDKILSAPDAGVDAGAAGDAGLGGLCDSPSYRDHPRCAGLRGKGAAPASR